MITDAERARIQSGHVEILRMAKENLAMPIPNRIGHVDPTDSGYVCVIVEHGAFLLRVVNITCGDGQGWLYEQNYAWEPVTRTLILVGTMRVVRSDVLDLCAPHRN